MSVNIDCPASMTIAHLGALSEKWAPFLHNNDNIVIRAEAVTQMDTAGLQFLLAFLEQAKKEGKRIVLTNFSSECLSHAHQLGLAHRFEDYLGD